MKKVFCAVILSLLLLVVAFQAAAQTDPDSSIGTSSALDTTGFPQWVKDLRRLDIVAFGSFPFTMFTVSLVSSFIPNSGMNLFWPDLSAPGGAGASANGGAEYGRAIAIAAGLSVAIAITDFIIVKIKQSRERRRVESMPSAGSSIIIKNPYQPPEEAPDSKGGGPEEAPEDSGVPDSE
jgi:hypothetical protein